MNSTGENRKTILLVDDERINRVLLKKIFSRDYSVLEAENGNQALEILRKTPDISVVILDIRMPEMDGFGVLAAMKENVALSDIPVIIVTGSQDDETQYRALDAGALDVLTKPFNTRLILHRVKSVLWQLDAVRMAQHITEVEQELKRSETDPATGLLNRSAFLRRAKALLQDARPGEYLLMRWDIDNFKVFNDIYGTDTGDAFLRNIGRVYQERGGDMPGLVLVCRYDADHFMLLLRAEGFDAAQRYGRLEAALLAEKDYNFTFVPRMGLYTIDDPTKNIANMCDLALLALRSVKNQYGVRYAWFDPAMRKELVKEHEIVGAMSEALQAREFMAYYQPQYNLSTGEMVGAEALAQWMRPVTGMVWPNDFIPLFEKNGFIFELDRYIWEEVCAFQRHRLDAGLPVVPVSVNVSRFDAVREDFFTVITELTDRYRLPRQLLNLEITESAFCYNTQRIISIAKKLREVGFTVEIDDFGSGYSSFNTLKDVPADVLKLDMRFLSDTGNVQRGGTIIQSIVRMAKWLGISVLAEGVETQRQADFLRSVGCNYAQGYLLSKPIPRGDFEALLDKPETRVNIRMSGMEVVDGMDKDLFWNPASMDTLIFSSYVGGACVLEYHNGNLELIRGNEGLLKQLHTSVDIEQLIGYDVFRSLSDRKREDFVRQVEALTQVGISRTGIFHAHIDTDDPLHNEYLRYTLRLIAQTSVYKLLYVLVENVSDQVRAERQNAFLNELAKDMLSITDNEQAVEKMLRKELHYFMGSQAYVFEFDWKKQTAANTYEVCREGTPSVREVLREVSFSKIPFWISALQKNNHMTVTTNGLDDSHREERAMLEAQGIRVLLVVPLRRDGKLIGFLGVDDPTNHGRDIAQLEALGDYMAILLTQRDLMRTIRRQKRDIS